MLAVAVCLLDGMEAQQQTKEGSGALKRYSFSSDGFAISSPQPPKLTSLKDSTEYGLYWNESTHVVIYLSVSRGPVDCTAWNAWAKSLNGNATRVTTVEGNPALETYAPRNGLQEGYELQQCIDGKVYHFGSGWPKGEPKPPIIDEVVKSFHGFHVLHPLKRQPGDGK